MKKPPALILVLILGILPLSVQAYTVIPLRHRLDITRDFLQPTDVAVGKDNYIYILDGVNNRVKVFDEQGIFMNRVFLSFLSVAKAHRKENLAPLLALQRTESAKCM